MKSPDERTRWDEALELLRLATAPSTRERVSIAAVLREARLAVQEEARARALAIVVVAVPDEVFVPRRDVVFAATALLRHAIRHVPSGGRVAITAQDFDDELVVAVYDQEEPRLPRLDRRDVVSEAAALLGGRAWSAPLDRGNLTLLAVPLYLHLN